MNIGLITSFLVGGLMLISILYFNNSVKNHNQELAMAQITQERMDVLGELLTNDINRLGFLDTSGDPIKTMTSRKFSFDGDIYDTDQIGVSTVTWEWKKSSSPVINSSNPNDYWLVRTGPINATTSGEVKFPVSYFNINYYNASGTTENISSVVRQIEIELIIESREPYYMGSSVHSETDFYRSIWKKTFMPNNLNKPY